jgi:hypothetical protein
MTSHWKRRILPAIVGAAAVAAVLALPATASGLPPGFAPPNFDIFAKGAVGFGCANPADAFPVCVNPPAFAITGDAPAYGTHVGLDARFQTVEIATPMPPDFANNSINGHAMITVSGGDQLFIHYCGISPAPSPDATGVGHLNDNLVFDITGGTGRFSNASGNGRLTATGDVFFDARPTIVSSQLRGTITMQTHGAPPALLCGTP